jgi:hypothetical protein
MNYEYVTHEPYEWRWDYDMNILHVHHMNGGDDEIMILKICICYMCTLWM